MSESSFQSTALRLDAALDRVAGLPADAREPALDAIRTLLDLDRETWARAMARIRARDAALADALADDDLVGGFLVLHGLHPRLTIDPPAPRAPQGLLQIGRPPGTRP